MQTRTRVAVAVAHMEEDSAVLAPTVCCCWIAAAPAECLVHELLRLRLLQRVLRVVPTILGRNVAVQGLQGDVESFSDVCSGENVEFLCDENAYFELVFRFSVEGFSHWLP